MTREELLAGMRKLRQHYIDSGGELKTLDEINAEVATMRGRPERNVTNRSDAQVIADVIAWLDKQGIASCLLGWGEDKPRFTVRWHLEKYASELGSRVTMDAPLATGGTNPAPVYTEAPINGGVGGTNGAVPAQNR